MVKIVPTFAIHFTISLTVTFPLSKCSRVRRKGAVGKISPFSTIRVVLLGLIQAVKVVLALFVLLYLIISIFIKL
jgi:hypothetical protein